MASGGVIMDIMILVTVIGFFLILLYLSSIGYKLEHIRKNTKVQMDQNDRIVDLLKEIVAADKAK
jgi:uncharacterized membrane protein